MINGRQVITRPLFAGGFALGTVSIFASLDKILDPEAFARSILNYRIICPSVLVTLSSKALPWTELVADFYLVQGAYKRSSTAILRVLLLIIVLPITKALVRGLDISCGCFTQGPRGQTRSFEASRRCLLGRIVPGHAHSVLQMDEK
jgi:hypothetical protein